MASLGPVSGGGAFRTVNSASGVYPIEGNETPVMCDDEAVIARLQAGTARRAAEPMTGPWGPVPATPRAPAVEASPVANADAVAGGETVLVKVPKRFLLRLDHDTVITIEAGVQRLQRAHAEHWWSKRNGVGPVDDEAAAAMLEALGPAAYDDAARKIASGEYASFDYAAYGLAFRHRADVETVRAELQRRVDELGSTPGGEAA